MDIKYLKERSSCFSSSSLSCIFALPLFVFFCSVPCSLLPVINHLEFDLFLTFLPFNIPRINHSRYWKLLPLLLDFFQFLVFFHCNIFNPYVYSGFIYFLISCFIFSFFSHFGDFLIFSLF